MLNSKARRRLVAVALLVGALLVLPAPHALAAGEGSEGESAATESQDQGIIDGAIAWLVELLGGDEESDIGPGMDPTGAV